MPKASSPRRARSRAPGMLSSSHLSLVPEKYASSTNPVLAVNSDSWPAARSASHNDAVRRSCQTMALRDRPAASALPEQGGFALIGDADRSQGARRDRGLGQRLGYDAGLRGPDLQRIVLDPPRLGINLGEFPLRHGADRPTVVEDDRPGTGGSLIQGQHEGPAAAGAIGHCLSDLAPPRKMVRFAASHSSPGRGRTRQPRHDSMPLSSLATPEPPAHAARDL